MMNADERKQIVVAFGLGFLFASFIFAFFDPRHGHDDKHYKYRSVHQAHESREYPKTKGVHNNEAVSVMERDDGLYVLVNGSEILLSANTNQGSASGEGLYVDIIAKSVSPNGNYVHYCELQTLGDSCLNYIYDIENAGLYRVEQGDATLASAVANYSSAWQEDGTLRINEFVSAQAIAPWVME